METQRGRGLYPRTYNLGVVEASYLRCILLTTLPYVYLVWQVQDKPKGKIKQIELPWKYELLAEYYVSKKAFPI
jgi:hypothetical protein